MILHKCASIGDLHCEKKHYDGIEIQLVPTKPVKPSDFFDENVIAVHPLLDTRDGFDVDVVNTTVRTMDEMHRAFAFAEEIAETQNGMIGVVTHCSLGVSKLIDYGILGRVTATIKEQLDRFPNTYILIENTPDPPFTGEDDSAVAKVVLGNIGFSYSGRVHNLLDTTHAYMSCKYLSVDRDGAYFKNLIKDYFKAYGEAGLCREIHFSNCISWGVDKENHGVDFREGNERDMRYFDFLCTLIEKYLPYADLCLEVREEDYTKPEAYGHIYDMLQKRMKKA